MSNYILDTNIISYLIDNNSNFHLDTINFIKSLNNSDEISISIITLIELEYALVSIDEIALKEKFKLKIEKLKNELNIYNINLEVPKIYASLKNKYKQSVGINSKNLKKDDMDILIASIAIANSAILVSSDKIFEKLSQISNLKHINFLNPDFTIGL